MSEDILIYSEPPIGRIRLNRPKVIHALNRGMCRTMIEALLAWHDDPAIRLVTIDHAEGRGFCAGGDIRTMAESGAGDGSAARAFFFDEYRLNHLLFTYIKPVVAFMDGITMGGGVGLAQPAKYRIATERTVFAMPEGAIGLFPDVGGGWYLARLPGRIGQFLALTGARLDGAECIALGIATHYVSSAKLDALKARLAEAPGEIPEVLADFAETPPPARILDNRARIDRLFAADRYEDILAALHADGSEWAQTELATLATKSAQSAKISLKLLAQSHAHLDFADEMRVEYRIAARLLHTRDLHEGVRALMLDKEHHPKWEFATPEAIPDAHIDRFFEPLPGGEEWSPLRVEGA